MTKCARHTTNTCQQPILTHNKLNEKYPTVKLLWWQRWWRQRATTTTQPATNYNEKLQQQEKQNRKEIKSLFTNSTFNVHQDVKTSSDQITKWPRQNDQKTTEGHFRWSTSSNASHCNSMRVISDANYAIKHLIIMIISTSNCNTRNPLQIRQRSFLVSFPFHQMTTKVKAWFSNSCLQSQMTTVSRCQTATLHTTHLMQR